MGKSCEETDKNVLDHCVHRFVRMANSRAQAVEAGVKGVAGKMLVQVFYKKINENGVVCFNHSQHTQIVVEQIEGGDVEVFLGQSDLVSFAAAYDVEEFASGVGPNCNNSGQRLVQAFHSASQSHGVALDDLMRNVAEGREMIS